MKEGWELKKLGEVCEIYSGGTPDSKKTEYWNGNIPFVTLVDTKSRYVYSTIRTITDEGLKKSSAVLLPIDTVLLSSRATIGEVAIAKVPLVTNQGYKNFVCNTEVILPEYLYYGLLSLKDYLTSMCNGAVYAEISKQKVSEIKIPLPTLPEQQRIVEMLDTAFAKIDTVKQNAERNLQNAKELFQSVLEFELTLKDGWEEKKLPQISDNLDSKRIPITQNKRTKGDYPYYGASGVVDYVSDYLFDEDLLLISEDGANLLARTYPIAFSVNGKIWVNNHAHVLKFKDINTQRFIEYYFSSIKIDNYVTGMAQPKLNQNSLNSIPIPIPPISEQQLIVSKLDALSAKCKDLENNYLKTINDCDELKKAILAKAFNGEL